MSFGREFFRRYEQGVLYLWRAGLGRLPPRRKTDPLDRRRRRFRLFGDHFKLDGQCLQHFPYSVVMQLIIGTLSWISTPAVFPLRPLWFSLLCCQFSLNIPKPDSGFPLTFPPNFFCWFFPKFPLKRLIFFSKTPDFEFGDEMKEVTAKTKGLFFSRNRVFNFQTTTKNDWTRKDNYLSVFKKGEITIFWQLGHYHP